MSLCSSSVTELLKAVDWVVKAITAYRQVQEQISGLRRSFETVRDQLRGIERALENCSHNVGDQAASFKSIQEDLFGVLNDTMGVLMRFKPLAESRSGLFSTARQNLRWMVDRRYSGDVTSLQDRIGNITLALIVQLQLLNL